MAGRHVIEHGLHQFVGRAGLLLHPTVVAEELFQRGVKAQEFVDFVAGATEPEKCLTIGPAYHVDDLTHDDFAVRSDQVGKAGEAEHLHFAIVEDLWQQLVGVVAGGVEERGAVDDLALVVGGNQHLKHPQDERTGMLHADEQVWGGLQLTEFFFLAEFVDIQHLAGLNSFHPHGGRAWHMGDNAPIGVVGIQTS